MKIIIPMSGIGRRFLDAGYTDPKPLIHVEGKPIIQHVAELFKGETEFIYICNDMHLRETDMRRVLETITPRCRIYEVSVDHRRGPVDAVLQIAALEVHDNDEIIVSYCDYGTEWDYEEFKRQIRYHHLDGCIACYKGFHPHMLGSDNYAFVRVQDNQEFLEIREKQPFTENKMNEFASNGTYYFRSGLLVKKYFQKLIDYNISTHGEFYVSMVYNLMKEDGLRIRVFEIEKMLQWGTPKDLEEYVQWSDYFLYRDPEFYKHYVDLYETTLLLPMAGAGSRFFSVGYDIPKPLLPVEEVPMVVQAVRCLPPTTRKIFICQKTHVQTYDIADTLHTYFPTSLLIEIDYITQGQACTCDIAFHHCDIDMEKHLLISACDNGVYYDMKTYLEMVHDPAVDIIIWAFSNHPSGTLYPHMYAWLDVDPDGFIRRVSIKKPFVDCENTYAIIGSMLFKKARYFKEGLEKIYQSDIRTNGEFYVDNMIEPLIHMGYRCKMFHVKNYLCWGTPNDYKTYNYWHEYFTKKRKQ